MKSKKAVPHLSIFHHSQGYSYQVLDGTESDRDYWTREDHHDSEDPDEYIESQPLPPLFASAPDMLAALNNLVDRGLIRDPDSDAMTEVLDAIAKATGQEIGSNYDRVEGK